MNEADRSTLVVYIPMLYDSTTVIVLFKAQCDGSMFWTPAEVCIRNMIKQDFVNKSVSSLR